MPRGTVIVRRTDGNVGSWTAAYAKTTRLFTDPEGQIKNV